MTRRIGPYAKTVTKRSRGFTLIEVVISIAVISIAATIVTSLFINCVDIAERNRCRKVAILLAEEQLINITISPELFTWPAFDPKLETLLPVGIPDEQEGTARGFDAPSVMPLDQRIHEHEAVFYEKFYWEAYARITSPEVGAGAAKTEVVELTVVVKWRDNGKTESVAITSALSQSALPDIVIVQEEAA